MRLAMFMAAAAWLADAADFLIRATHSCQVQVRTDVRSLTGQPNQPPAVRYHSARPEHLLNGSRGRGANGDFAREI